MYRGKNPSRNSVGHFDPLKKTDEIKKSMGQNGAVDKRIKIKSRHAF
jgi:hypothetical protein